MLSNMDKLQFLIFMFAVLCHNVSLCIYKTLPSVLWRCWMGSRKGIQPVKSEWWRSGMVICLERGADLVLPFSYRLTRVVPGKRAVKRVCVYCMCEFISQICLTPSSTSFQNGWYYPVACNIAKWWHFQRIIRVETQPYLTKWSLMIQTHLKHVTALFCGIFGTFFTNSDDCIYSLCHFDRRIPTYLCCSVDWTLNCLS